MTTHYVYSLFSESGELLYVGVSSIPLQRLRQHELQRPWWPEVDISRLEMDEYPSEEAGRAAELDAIRAGSPKYNVVGKLQPIGIPESARDYQSAGGKDPSELLTLEEIATLTKTSINTVRYWRHAGIGPKFARIGRKVMARRWDVEAWIDAQFEAAS